MAKRRLKNTKVARGKRGTVERAKADAAWTQSEAGRDTVRKTRPKAYPVVDRLDIECPSCHRRGSTFGSLLRLAHYDETRLVQCTRCGDVFRHAVKS